MDVINEVCKAVLAIEKQRVATGIRLSHLAQNGTNCAETEAIHSKLVDLEEYLDARLSQLIKENSAYYWFSRVKGVGKENIGKVIGLIKIEKAPTISSLWKFCGFSVDDGKAPRSKKGEKQTYNSRLRTMCWRLATSLMRARGTYYRYYLGEKDKYQTRYVNEGLVITKGKEKEGQISEGHIHNQALRKMIKLFLSHLWLTWREAEGLPITSPYSIGVLNHHSLITPESMVDKEAKK